MENHYLIKSFILLSVLIGITVTEDNELIAVTTKAKGDVTFRPWDSKDFTDLKPAKALNDGDHIQTGSDGFGALVYLDDKSTIKIKENTDFDVIGSRDEEGISKRIKINSGTIKAKIQEGSTSGFVIETPTSVATVKGTEFWLVASSDGDKVFGLEGIVELTNVVSGEIVMVGVNETGTSLPTGEVEVTATVSEDIPTEEEEQEINEFEIEFEGPDGNQKTMKIKYR
mgnify:CR=1 FL=1